MSGQTDGITCPEDIQKLPDVQACRALMKSWGIQAKGLRNRDDYIQLLLQHWNNHGDTRKPEMPDPGTGLRDAIEVDKKNRVRMTEKCEQIIDFFNRLLPQHQKNLLQTYPDLKEKMQQMVKELKSRECTILVAGETGSGKSSFINLLLEMELFPTSALSCTKTVCEIRKSVDGRSYAIVHYRPSEGSRKRPPDLLDLSNPAGLDDLRKRLVYEDEEGDTPFEKIEVHMPFPMLEEGIVIVDTPGIGERRQVNMLMEKYLSKSFGTIYLVNTSAAGGVNKGRLKDFLRMVVNTVSDDFNPSSSIFIGNKEDCVDKRDLQEVKDRVVFKLKECYPGLKEDKIFFMSVTEAQKAFRNGIRLKAHTEVLLHGIQKLYPASLRNKLTVHYRYMSEILKRSIYTVKVARTLAATGMEKKQDEVDEIKSRMDILERNAKHTVENLKKEVQIEEDKIHRNITGLLRSRSFTDHVFFYKPGDCAKAHKDYKNVARDVNDIISNRIAHEVEQWDTQTGVTDQIKEAIVIRFQRECQMYEEQIKEIEGTLTDGDVRMITDLHKSMKKQAPVKHLWQRANKASKGDANDKMNSLGNIVSSAGGIDTGDKAVKKMVKEYKVDNNVQKMHDLTAKYIDTIFNGDDLRIKLKRFVGRYIKGIDSIAKKIPEFLEADRQLMKNIKEEMENAENNLKQIFPEMLHRGNVIQGELDLFFVQKIMEMDYRLRDVMYEPSRDLLGSGSFADVYKAQLITGGYSETVALKISKEILKENNVTDILLEDRTMRELDHENIVRYYGSTLKQEVGKGRPRLYWIMIIEYCTDTLKGLVIDGEFDNPSKCKIYAVQVEQMEIMARYAEQLCSGVAYLHEKGLVHRDIKLENILVTEKRGSKNEYTIKVTDVGLTKPVSQLAGSNVGSPAYMAPEVLLQTGLYDRKADIYAIGIVLWEMWYGIDAAQHIGENLFGTLEKAVKGGLRPSMTLTQKPEASWASLIKKCWEYNPKDRPEARDVKNFFSDFLNKH